MLAVEQNSTKLRKLTIGKCVYAHNYDGKCKGKFNSRDPDDYGKLGKAIGDNTHLKELEVSNLNDSFEGQNLILSSTNATGFCDGVRRNSSITSLLLSHLNRDKVGVTHEVLRACLENKTLTKLHIYSVYYDDQLIVGALRRCTNLRRIKIADSGVDEEQLLQIIEAIRGHQLIQELQLFNNSVDDRGCEALATLRNVRSLDISVNIFGNEGAIAFANSLSANKCLQRCILDYNQVSARVSDDFCRSLCNTSSINDIYWSNHTLESTSISIDEDWIGLKLTSLLKLNRSTRNKRHVAIKKILLYHAHAEYDMEPLFDLSLEEDGSGRDIRALPHVISWFETAKEAIVGDVPRAQYDLELKKISAIHQFVTAMPMSFIPPSHDKGDVDKKRKRSTD